jgi:hypothetical protein
MAVKLPRVLGLADLLRLQKPLREKPEPLVYLTDREFGRLLKGADELPLRPRGNASLATFLPWPGGGMVQQSCESPPGQNCVGQWVPAGPRRSGGLYFGCRCHAADGGIEIVPTCQLLLTSTGFRCVGECTRGGACRPGYWRDPNTRRVTLDCRCRPVILTAP